jgi:hypothetical protein
MNRSINTLLVWLLMALLPLHAIAAGAGMACASMQQGQDKQSTLIVHDADAAMHAHGAHMGEADGTDSGQDAPVAKVHSSCSACSALCVGAVAPPSAQLPLPAVEGSDDVLISSSSLGPEFIPEGPQRPPRRHFA